MLAVLTESINVNTLRGKTRQTAAEEKYEGNRRSPKKVSSHTLFQVPVPRRGFAVMGLDRSRTGFEGCIHSWCGQFQAFIVIVIRNCKFADHF
jgi:hypothetical protein